MTIDKEFLDSFLSYGLKFFNKTFSDFKENTSEVFSFLNLYGIDFEHMLQIGSGDMIIEDLITFALNFEEYRDPLLKKAIFAITNKIKKEQLRRLYLKIQAYKLFLRTFFSECIIYALFGFFISGCFLDFRGRLYYQGYFLNLQNYKITKAFIKLYGSNTKATIEENFQLIKDTILGTFNNLEAPNQLSSVNEYMYKKANGSFFEDYLFSYVDSKKITKDAFILLINTKNTFASLHAQISNIIKKKTRSFVVLSYILSPHSIFFTNICSLDAVSSGSQMTSILLRSKKLGKLSNLIGDLDFEVYKN